VRLLNGAHTLMVPLALLMGLETVREAIEHPMLGRFVRRALFEEIVPGLEAEGAEAFARAVLDRFANPFIRHALLDITLQQTMKVRVRVVPSIVRHAERTGRAPESLSLAFAAWLLYMRGDLQQARREAGLPVPADDQAARLRSHWGRRHADDGVDAGLVRAVASDVALWNVDLSAVPGFVEAVTDALRRLRRDGPAVTLAQHLALETR
jgi:tagaturonate reductase